MASANEQPSSTPSFDRGKVFVEVLACVLGRLVAVNDAKPSPSTVVTKFHALRPPSISILDYLKRINKYAGCSPECFVLALVYIDMLIARNGIALTSYSIHRAIITAVLVAAKFFDDQYYNNAYYAKVGGVPCAEVNSLELELLFSCGFSLHVSTDTFEKYFKELVGHCFAPPDGRCTCECSKYAPLLGFAPDEIVHTGLRPDLIAAAAAAAVQLGGAAGSPREPTDVPEMTDRVAAAGGLMDTVMGSAGGEV